MYVIKGNTAIFKCIVPSFVADYVSVVSWEDTVGNEYSVSSSADHFGIIAIVFANEHFFFFLQNTIFLYFPSFFLARGERADELPSKVPLKYNNIHLIVKIGRISVEKNMYRNDQRQIYLIRFFFLLFYCLF